MHYVVSLLAYGDSLITLSLLERIGAAQGRYQVIGSGVTCAVSQLMRQPPPITKLLEGEAALYTVKDNGIFRAAQDFKFLRTGFRKLAKPGDVFAFELPAGRSRALVPEGCGYEHPLASASVYDDRHQFISRLIENAGPWTPTARPATPIKRVLINPCARHSSRWLRPEVMESLLSIARRRDWHVTVLDPCGHHQVVRKHVDQYLTQSSLVDAAALLRESDLYIGPDSFFIHLAYYFRVPCFGFFLPHHLIYLLPGMRQLGNFIFFEQARSPAVLEKTLLHYVDGS